MPNLDDFLGTYKILGSNQDEEASNYQGILELSSIDDEIVEAKWTIGSSQKHSGIGLLEDSRLVLKFRYLGDDGMTYHGVVEYHLVEKGILEGFWTEEYGDNRFLGTEQCFKIETTSKAQS